MTLETAKAILRTSRQDASRQSQVAHSYADRLAFEHRMARLRPRKFLRMHTGT
jgi:hypothetical protein